MSLKNWQGMAYTECHALIPMMSYICSALDKKELQGELSPDVGGGLL